MHATAFAWTVQSCRLCCIRLCATSPAAYTLIQTCAILPIVCAPLAHDLAGCVRAVRARSCRLCEVPFMHSLAGYALDSLCATLPVASSCCLCAILRLHMRAQHAICQLRGCQRSATLPVAMYKFDFKSDYKSVCKSVARANSPSALGRVVSTSVQQHAPLPDSTRFRASEQGGCLHTLFQYNLLHCKYFMLYQLPVQLRTLYVRSVHRVLCAIHFSDTAFHC